ncbi:hypothetical protein ES707_09958 [subsurface metagenome]|jgi:hypothetical protein
MKTPLMITATAVALSLFGFVTTAASPAQAGEYCSVNTSGMRGCGYATMEQCKATMSGGLGTCMRDPFYNNSNALVLQAKSASATRSGYLHNGKLR